MAEELCRLPSGTGDKFIPTGEFAPEAKLEEFGACDPWLLKVGVLLKLPPAWNAPSQEKKKKK